jgi:hypothetical protein
VLSATPVCADPSPTAKSHTMTIGKICSRRRWRKVCRSRSRGWGVVVTPAGAVL